MSDILANLEKIEKEQIKKNRFLLEKILNKEPDQLILHIKAHSSRFFENERHDCYTFRDGKKFGFSERLVNRMLEYAYECGKKHAQNSNKQIKENLKHELKRKLEEL